MQGPRSADERRAAFESVALPLMRSVYSRALQLARHSDVAADLLQETFLRAFRTFDSFTPGTNAKAWLLTILYSRFISRHRKQSREPEEIALEDVESMSSTDGTLPQVTLDPKMWASEEVHAALTQLSDDARVVLLMVDVDDFTYDQVASALHCPIGTVRSRLARARHATYNALERYARERGYLGGKP